MWGKAKNKKVDFDRHIGRTTMIAAGTQIHGDIKFEGGLLVEGTVYGSVSAEEGSDSLLRIAESGEIRGEIRVPNIVINGQVNGDVYSSSHIELATKAIVNGNVNYNLIEMIVGAEINGALVHPRESSIIGSASAVPEPAKPAVTVNIAPPPKVAPLRELTPKTERLHTESDTLVGSAYPTKQT